MSTLPGEPSRRDNGIEAAAYVLLRAVDRDLVPVVLAALAKADIAAYATVPDASQVSSHDLWVATDAAGEARRIAARVQREQGRVHLDPYDVDARFAELVAGFDGPSEVPDPATTDSGSDTGPTAPRSEGPASVGAGWRSPTSEVSSLDDPPDDPDDHFVPPPVGPQRRPSPRAALGIALILVGGAIMIFPDLLGLGITATLILGVLAAASGLGVLLLGLRDDGDDYDDGAVV